MTIAPPSTLPVADSKPSSTTVGAAGNDTNRSAGPVKSACPAKSTRPSNGTAYP